MNRKHYISKKQVVDALNRLNSQSKAACELGTSQMTISRLVRRFKISHDGRPKANKAKGQKQGRILKKRYKSGAIIPHWLGKKRSKKFCNNLSRKLKGRPAWNSGTIKLKTTKCGICCCKFLHPKCRWRKFCSRRCTYRHLANINSGTKLSGENNPNFGNGKATRAAYKRGCYANRVLPKHSMAKGGRHKGKWMRSSWEIEYAKFLDTKGISWLYESKRFTLSDGRTYTPDFYLPATNTYVEIKGHWFPAAKAKFAMFKKEFHNVKIIVIEDKLWH